MARFFLAICSRAGEPAPVPKLRRQQTAHLAFDLAAGGRRCTLYHVVHQAATARKPILREAGARLPEQTEIALRMGDEADVALHLRQDQLTITVPLGCVRQVYHRRDQDAWLFSDDPRLVAQAGMSLDVRGLLCQLELGAHPGAFTPWREIRRIPLGISLTVDLINLASRATPAALWEEPSSPPPGRAADDSERLDTVAALIDQAMRRVCPQGRGVVLFSGGVDSGLLAARAAAMGWKEFILAHSSRGPQDRETENARQMAAALKLRFQAFEYRPEQAIAHLSEMFDSYTPANDFSMMPTWDLAQQILEAFPAEDVALDGTGADGIFGGLKSWRKARLLYWAPAALRQFGGWVYRAKKLWLAPSATEDFLRIVRRCAMWPFPTFRLVLNPLEGIAYHAPRKVRRELAEAMLDWLERTAGTLPKKAHPKFLALASGTWRSSPKATAALDDAGVMHSFPYHDPGVLRYALREVVFWPAHLREGKGSLKRLLARSVPAALIYRPKSGLAVLPVPLFGQPAFLSAFAEVLEDSSGPFRDLLDMSVVRELYQAIARRQELAWYTYEFVWALVFGHHWIRRIQRHAAH